jgi:hypothetical protein
MTPAGEDGEAGDPYARLLSRNKANYTVRHESRELRWANGVLVSAHPTGVLGGLERKHCERVFLDLLDATTAENQVVSSSKNSGNFAPALFALRPDREGYRRGDFARAMQTLFASRKIVNAPYGRPSDVRWRIAKVAHDQGK